MFHVFNNKNNVYDDKFGVIDPIVLHKTKKEQLFIVSRTLLV
jgi:hypothetical protein